MTALQKLSFALTDYGHKYDEAENLSILNRINDNLKNEEEYAKKSPLPRFLSGNRPGKKFFNEVDRNRAAYKAKKHKNKENTYNPFAGRTDESYKKSMEELKKN